MSFREYCKQDSGNYVRIVGADLERCPRCSRPHEWTDDTGRIGTFISCVCGATRSGKFGTNHRAGNTAKARSDADYSQRLSDGIRGDD